MKSKIKFMKLGYIFLFVLLVNVSIAEARKIPGTNLDEKPLPLTIIKRKVPLMSLEKLLDLLIWLVVTTGIHLKLLSNEESLHDRDDEFQTNTLYLMTSSLSIAENLIYHHHRFVFTTTTTKEEENGGKESEGGAG
jgi:hypothetical protein